MHVYVYMYICNAVYVFFLNLTSAPCCLVNATDRCLSFCMNAKPLEGCLQSVEHRSVSPIENLIYNINNMSICYMSSHGE